MSNLKFPIYLDNHATTPLDPRVLKEMMPYFTQDFGNPASMDHVYGSRASAAIEKAREQIAKAINSRPEEIIFTSGATEADNLALKGVVEHYGNKGDHIITCVTEHKAILDTCKYLEKLGKQVTYLPVDQYGLVNVQKLKDSITERTILISIMFANNEIGTIAPIREIGRIAHQNDILFHTDAAQAIGHIPVDVEAMQIDLMSISAHKTYGPKGIGALYVRRRSPKVQPSPMIHGGGHERGMRSGTLNVPAIVGFGKALEIARKEMDEEAVQFLRWSRSIMDRLGESMTRWELNGHSSSRLAHNLNIYFTGIESKAIIQDIRSEIALSAGSACTSDLVEPSHVILALGAGLDKAHSSIRIGLGRFNTEEEIDYAASRIVKAVNRLQKVRA